MNTCDYPKVKGVYYVSKYMLKKYGIVEALRRHLKRIDKKK